MNRPDQTPGLLWSDTGNDRLLKVLVLVLLGLVLVIGIIVPMINLPEPDRSELEEIPPQLARLVERKKEIPPPEPEPVVPDVQEEPEPEPEPEPQPEPEPEPPKPEPVKQEQKKEVEATEEQRQVAREKARESVGTEALSALAELRAQLPVAALATSSSGLSSGGSQSTEIGSVVNRDAATSSSGGVDTSELTTSTTGETLAAREVTQVEVTEEQVASNAALRKRSTEELRLVFESYSVHYDKIYRRALRGNPALEGTVTLALTIQPNGTVSACEATKTELDDAGLIRRVESKCRQMQFENRPQVEVAKVEYPIRFNP